MFLGARGRISHCISDSLSANQPNAPAEHFNFSFLFFFFFSFFSRFYYWSLNRSDRQSNSTNEQRFVAKYVGIWSFIATPLRSTLLNSTHSNSDPVNRLQRTAQETKPINRDKRSSARISIEMQRVSVFWIEFSSFLWFALLWRVEN